PQEGSRNRRPADIQAQHRDEGASSDPGLPSTQSPAMPSDAAKEPPAQRTFFDVTPPSNLHPYVADQPPQRQDRPYRLKWHPYSESNSRATLPPPPAPAPADAY